MIIYFRWLVVTSIKFGKFFEAMKLLVFNANDHNNKLQLLNCFDKDIISWCVGFVLMINEDKKVLDSWLNIFHETNWSPVSNEVRM